jgi:hypothetical protein
MPTVTLQNGGLVYYPEYVFNHEEIVREPGAIDLGAGDGMMQLPGAYASGNLTRCWQKRAGSRI